MRDLEVSALPGEVGVIKPSAFGRCGRYAPLIPAGLPTLSVEDEFVFDRNCLVRASLNFPAPDSPLILFGRCHRCAFPVIGTGTDCYRVRRAELSGLVRHLERVFRS